MTGRSSTVLLLALLLLAACKTPRPIAILNRELPARSPEKLLERVLSQNNDTFRYYSAKASVSVELPDGGKSFKAQIRSVRDSAAWVSIIPGLGVEVARIMLTQDSLMLMDRLKDQYFTGDTAEARAKFGLQPGLGLLQKALLGLPIGLDPSEKYRSDREEGQYVLTTKEKRRIVRAAEDISPSDTLDNDRDMRERRLERTLRKAEEREAVVMRYWIEPDSFHISRVQITDMLRDRIADVRYELRGGADVNFLPTRISITMSEPGRQATGVLELSRIELEGPLQLNFRVPEKFVPMP